MPSFSPTVSFQPNIENNMKRSIYHFQIFKKFRTVQKFNFISRELQCPLLSSNKRRAYSLSSRQTSYRQPEQTIRKRKDPSWQLTRSSSTFSVISILSSSIQVTATDISSAKFQCRRQSPFYSQATLVSAVMSLEKVTCIMEVLYGWRNRRNISRWVWMKRIHEISFDFDVEYISKKHQAIKIEKKVWNVCLGSRKPLQKR